MYPGTHSRSRPDQPAYIMADTGQIITYAELEARSNQIANLFRDSGMLPGDGIAILLDNNPVYLQIAWAAQRSGLYYTPISILFQQAEIEYILENSDVRILITHSRFLKVLSQLPEALVVYLIDQPENGPEAVKSWPLALRNQSDQPIADECEGAEMIYSSGTTGQPKGVRFNLNQSPMGTVSELFKTRATMHQVSEKTVYLSTAPLYHSAPLRYNMMVTRFGGVCIVMAKFDAERALQLIEHHRVTHSQWVPTMFIRLLRLSSEVRHQYDLSSLQFAIHAAAPCPVAVKQDMLDWWGPKLYEYYSGTEANGQTAITPEQWLSHKGSVGRAIHGEIHILDDNEQELAPLEIGTVYFANGSDFSYYKDPDKTRRAKTDAGWSTLGDMGYVDSEGYLYLKDRKSYMIISGGVNIYPQEIEDLLLRHEAVSDVAVFGVPDDEFGEAVKAVVEPKDMSRSAELLSAELIEFCRQHLSHVKCPRSIDFMETLPRHPTGKLYKRELRDRYWKDHNSKII